jgi:hypothetical protein
MACDRKAGAIADESTCDSQRSTRSRAPAAARPPAPFRRVRFHEKHGDRRFTEHAFRIAAHDQATQATSPMSAHHDYVRAPSGSFVHDPVRHPAEMRFMKSGLGPHAALARSGFRCGQQLMPVLFEYFEQLPHIDGGLDAAPHDGIAVHDVHEAQARALAFRERDRPLEAGTGGRAAVDRDQDSPERFQVYRLPISSPIRIPTPAAIPVACHGFSCTY